MEKKYEFTGETMEYKGHTLHRIKALKDLKCVTKGEIGGWIESEDNLSHFGNCWVDGESKVYEGAKVTGDARITYNAEVYGDAKVEGEASVHNNAKVYGEANVGVSATICGNAHVCGNAYVFDYAYVSGNAVVTGSSWVADCAVVIDNAVVFNKGKVTGMAKITGNARIGSDGDYIVFHNFWKTNCYFTWTRSNNMWNVDCFCGTSKEIIERAYEDSEESGKNYEKIVKYVESMI